MDPRHKQRYRIPLKVGYPGVIFLLPSVRRQQQLDLFAAALDEVAANPDLTDYALDVHFSGTTKIVVRRYPIV
jgi:hypothetical protein